MAEKGKRSFMQIIIIVVIILVIDIIGGYIIGVKMLIPHFYKTEYIEENNESTVVSDESGTGRTVGLERALDSINLNPAGSGGEILSCDIVLEAESPEVIAELTSRNFEIMDKISTYLSFKTVSELNNPENWEVYRNDMLNIVNSILSTGKITYLHIPQKIIQFD